MISFLRESNPIFFYKLFIIKLFYHVEIYVKFRISRKTEPENQIAINLRIKVSFFIMVHYFINKIKRISNRPSNCVNCNGLDLKPDAVLATIGPSEKNADYVFSVLCLSCETLMIVTTHSELVVGIHHTVGNQVTMRNS